MGKRRLTILMLSLVFPACQDRPEHVWTPPLYSRALHVTRRSTADMPVAELVEAVRTGSLRERLEALAALPERDHEQAVAVGTEIVRDNDNPRLRRAAARMLAEVESIPEETKRVMLAVLSDPRTMPMIRSELLRSLSAHSIWETQMEDVCFGLMRGDHPCAGARALGKAIRGDRELAGRILSALEVANPPDAAAVGYAIGYAGLELEGLLPSTLKMLNDKKSEVRARVAAGIIDWLKERSVAVPIAAGEHARIPGTCSKEAISALQTVLDGVDICSLAKAEVRWSLSKLKVADERMDSLLLHHFTRERVLADRRLVSRGLGRAIRADTAIVTRLLGKMDQSTKEVRNLIASGIGNAGLEAEGLLPVILKLLNDERPEIRTGAAAGFTTWLKDKSGFKPRVVES